MNREHLRPILIALAASLLAVAAYLAIGLQTPARPLYLECRDLGYASSDSGLANCADTLQLPCGSPYTDHLRENC